MANARILIVEDESIVAMEIERILKDLGYIVLAVVSSGEESIQKAEETRPDLVLMDIKLEGEMDGIAAAEQIRAKFDIPVIYLTAYADEETLTRAKITEPYSYILKPFEKRELHVAIEMTLHKHKAERALKVSHQFLKIANRHTKMTPMFKEVVAEIKNFTGCSAVGIRLLDEKGNIPYKTYKGFSRRFCESENSLSIKSDECICVDVIKGTIEPKLPFYTEDGSFYMNDTTRFLATVSEEEKVKTCNVCNQFGYESVALVPIRSEDDIAGLIHVAEPRKNMVPLEIIEILESIAMQLSMTIQRIQAEKMLWEKEEHLRAVITSAPIVLFAVNRKGIITLLEGRELDTLGIKASEIIGKSFFDVFRNLPDVDENIFRALDGKNSISKIEFAGRALDIRLSPLRNQINEIAGVVGVATDVTEYKQAERELVRLSGAVKTSVDSIVLSDIKGNIIDVNEATLKMYGTDDKGDLIGKSVFDFIAPEDQKEAFAGMVETLEKGYVKNREYHAITKNGGKIPVEVSTSLLKEEEEPIGFAGIIRNITERKQSENLLRESEEKYRVLFEGSRDTIYITTREGKLTDINQSGLNLFGYTKKEIIGLDILNIYVNPADWTNFQQKIEQNGFIRDYKVKLRKKDGTEMDCLITAAVRWGDDEKILGYQGIIHEVTERETD